MSKEVPRSGRPEPVIVGPASPRKKQECAQMILGRFGQNHYVQIPEDIRQTLTVLEYGKKPYEKSAIGEANKMTNSLIREFGLTPFNVPERNFHIIPDGLYKRIGGGSHNREVAITFQSGQFIALNAERGVHPITRVSAILHEMIHLKNYFAIEAHEDSCQPHRNGLKVYTSRKKEGKIGFFTSFSGLNEAVVSEIEKRYLLQVVQQNQFLEDEYKWEISEKAKELREKIAAEKGIEPDEIIWVSKDGKDYGQLPYYEQRRVLYYIVRRIYEDNQERFHSEDEVMKLFFRSYFDGRLLTLARLIEKSFGKGAFRMVGMMDDDNKNSARLVMDYLTKRRKRRR